MTPWRFRGRSRLDRYAAILLSLLQALQHHSCFRCACTWPFGVEPIRVDDQFLFTKALVDDELQQGGLQEAAVGGVSGQPKVDYAVASPQYGPHATGVNWADRFVWPKVSGLDDYAEGVGASYFVVV